MADWSLEWLTAPPPMPYDPYQFAEYDPYYREKKPPVQPLPPQAQALLPPPSPRLGMPEPQQQFPSPPVPLPMQCPPTLSKVDNPREIRNKAEKQRRDKLNQSIADLAALVPPVVSSTRKVDKTGVLRYTAHYLRAHQYVFGPCVDSCTDFSPSSVQALLGFVKGFLLTTTYKGLVVVVSQNITDYLGYTELELLGRSVFGIVHQDDRELFKDQLMPRSQKLGQHGELLSLDEPDGRQKVAEGLANEKKRFIIRFKKLSQRSEPCKFVTCHVEGSFRMSDRACRGYNRCCQMLRRARARGDNPYSSGNDVVFIGIVRPLIETFINESALEYYRMEYRTRHSIDGEIIDCEQRIALVTGYMTSEVNGINAMNFIHRDEVRYVIIALKEMYNHNHLFGESCYRLMMKNGEFIYMRTRGKLDVDVASQAVTSFVCTNTVVDEKEGKHLIKLMKERFMLHVDHNEQTAIEDGRDTNDSQTVEDPRQLEKVILNLVTNLPSPQAASPNVSPLHGESLSHRLALIPPKKERIVSAIEKIYTVIKTIPKQPSFQPDIAHDHIRQASTPTYSEASELAPINDAYFPMQSGTETEQRPEPSYSPVVSSECEHALGTGMTRSYEESSTGYTNSLDFCNGYEMNDMLPDVDFLAFPPPDNAMKCQKELTTLFADSNAMGTKRPKNIFEVQEMATKKKITNITTEQNATNEQTSSRDSPNLEMFFDETFFNTQIEADEDLSEVNLDPSFLNLLISKEIDEILEKMETEPSEN